MNVFLNNPVGIKFYNRLRQNHVYDANPKSISAAYYVCQEIGRLNAEEKEDNFYSNYPAESIKHIFKGYITGSYHPYTNALEQLGLLSINNSYSNGNANSDDNFCRAYRTSDECNQLVFDAGMEYLSKLYKDTNAIRKIERNHKDRLRNQTNYQSYILEHIADGINHFKANFDKASEIITNYKDKDSNKIKERKTKLHMMTSLSVFAEKDLMN